MLKIVDNHKENSLIVKMIFVVQRRLVIKIRIKVDPREKLRVVVQRKVIVVPILITVVPRMILKMRMLVSLIIAIHYNIWSHRIFTLVIFVKRKPKIIENVDDKLHSDTGNILTIYFDLIESVILKINSNFKKC